MIEHVIETDLEPAVMGLTFGVELRAASEPGFDPEDLGRRIGDFLPVGSKSDAELCDELRLVAAFEAKLAGYKTELVIALAGKRPPRRGEPLDGMWGPGEVQLPQPSEFFPDELSHVLHLSRTAATDLAETANVLHTRCRATWGRLADGRLDWPRARAIAAELGWPAKDLPDRVVAAVEAEVLPRATELKIRGLRELVRARLLAHGVDLSEQRRRRAESTGNVTVQPGYDGMAELRVRLPVARARACRDAADRYARMLRADGDPRPLGLLRADMVAHLILRPWDTTRPAVTAQLSITAPLSCLRAGSKQVAAVDGQPITADHLREILTELDAVCPGGLQAPAGGSLHISLVDPISGELRAVLTRAELETLVRRGCPDHPGESCDCPVLDRPDPVNRYRPSAALYRFVRTRDRTCRWPGCTNAAAWADLDHVTAHACGGPTDCANLCCLCRRHHRIKTHEPGWLFVMTDNGVLTVTSPAGISRTTWPPGMHYDSTEPPPF
jgi:hypothetical protein